MGDSSDRFKLFIGGLSRETSDVALREHFSKYGEVIGCIVALDRETGERRGFGFVTFADSDAFHRALGDSHLILQRTVDVKKAVPRIEQLRNKHCSNGLSNNCTSNNHQTSKYGQCSTRKIFVGGLSPNLTEKEFQSYFEQFGRITDVVVMHDNMTNRPRGFGFITFDSEESVDKVTRKCFHELGGKLAEVKRAVPKDEVITKDGGQSPRVENGICNYSDHQFGISYIPYPIYTPVTTGYGETFGYPCVPPSPYGTGFPVGGFYGVTYEVANVGPSSPMIFPSPPFGFRASPMPFGSVSTFYPPYLNGMCNGFANMGLYKDSTGFGNGGGPANVSSIQITEIESNGVSTMDR